MQFETTMKMLQTVLVAREIYKCHFKNTMIFSNYLLASVHVNLMLSLFYFHKLGMQGPISRNTLKYLNLDKLKHYITCKSYTKVNSKVRFT